MISFRINLIRGQVPDSRARRLQYWGMIGYLALAGLLLVVTIGVATTRVVEASQLGGRIRAMERRFAEETSVTTGIRGHANGLTARLERRVKSLTSVDAALKSSIPLAPMLRSILLSLPPGVTIDSFSVDAGKRSVEFRLLVQVAGAESDPVPPDLLALWQKDAALSAMLPHVSYLGSEVASRGSRNDVVWRFSGQAAEPGT